MFTFNAARAEIHLNQQRPIRCTSFQTTQNVKKGSRYARTAFKKYKVNIYNRPIQEREVLSTEVRVWWK